MLRSWPIRLPLLLLVLAILLFGAGPRRRQEEWRDLAQPSNFSIMGWEVKNVWGKWAFRAQFWHTGRDDNLKKRNVEAYFSLASEIAEVEGRLAREAAISGRGAQSAGLETGLRELRERQALLAPEVEETLEAQISQAVRDEGITLALDLGVHWRFQFPFTDVKFDSLPQLLIISPREVIETRDTVLLQPEMTLSQVEGLEARVGALGVSALVEGIGGLATFPTLIPKTSSLEGTLSTAAHEWMHTYLFFKPLGQGYGKDQRLRSINETVADMVGRELASRVLVDAYARPPLPTPGPPGPPPEPIPVEDPVLVGEDVFDFNREMRRIRLEVDRLLAAGEVDAAERFMEEKRLFLRDQGYPIRKLNQAYFAFHGSYTDSPASVDPLGGQLAELRRRSSSLVSFVKAVERISSYQDFLVLVEPRR